MTAPTNQEFVSGTTITSQWLNGVNDHVNNINIPTHPADTITFTQAGTISSTNVQDAITLS